MKLTPLDIRKQEFSARVRGIDREEVQAFLQMVASQWEELQEEQRRLEEKVRDLDSKLQHYRNVEEALQEALRTARENAKDALETGRQKANVLVQEAESRAADVNRAAKEERRRLKRQVSRLSSRHQEILTRLRTFLTAEMELLSRYDSHDSIDLLNPIPSDDSSLESAPAERGQADEPEPDGQGATDDDVPLPPWALFQEGDDEPEELLDYIRGGSRDQAERERAVDDEGISPDAIATSDDSPGAGDRPLAAAGSDQRPEKESADTEDSNVRQVDGPVLAFSAEPQERAPGTAEALQLEASQPEIEPERGQEVAEGSNQKPDARLNDVQLQDAAVESGPVPNVDSVEASTPVSEHEHEVQPVPEAEYDEGQPSDAEGEDAQENGERPTARWISHRVFSALRPSNRATSEPNPKRTASGVDEAKRSWTAEPEESESKASAPASTNDSDQLSISTEEVERIRRILKGLDQA